MEPPAWIQTRSPLKCTDQTCPVRQGEGLRAPAASLTISEVPSREQELFTVQVIWLSSTCVKVQASASAPGVCTACRRAGLLAGLRPAARWMGFDWVRSHADLASLNLDASE